MKKLIYILTAILGVSACREQIPESAPQERRVQVRFAVTLPEPTPVRTRAWSDTDVDNIDLLVFDHNGLFIERIEATDIAGAGSVKTFAARMELSNNARTIYIVANGRDPGNNTDRVNFSSIGAGVSHTVAIPGMQTTPSLTPATVDDIFPLVMWGRATASSITSSVTITGLKLLRAQACITVGTDAPDTTNGLDKFTLASFSISKATAYGKVAPEAYTGAAAIPATPNAAGVPLVNYYNGETGGYWAQAASPIIYVYDRSSSATDHASLVIKGSYDGQAGYYRVVMVNGAGNPLDIVRNHRYIVTIVKASGAGYPSLDEALNNAPSNALKVSITDDRDDIALIVADGQNELGVSNNRVVIRGLNTGKSLDIATAYMTRSASRAVYNNCPALNSVTISLGSDGLCRIAALCSGSAGTGTITITDGSLKQVIDVEVDDFASGMTAAANDLYIASPTFLTSANRPWYIEIAPGSEYVWLHSSATVASEYPGGTADTWGARFLSSAVFGTANLYVHQISPVEGMLKYTYMAGTNQTVARMIFNK